MSKNPSAQKVTLKSTEVIENPPPSIRRRTWSPPEKIVQKPKPVVTIPPVRTKPWHPPTRKKEIKKPVIEYPPLKLKPWISPLLVKKPKKKLHQSRSVKVIRPPVINNLDGRWHFFKPLNPKLMILKGSISHTSKKFSYVTNGKQVL